jgi:hypothetical protein
VNKFNEGADDVAEAVDETVSSKMSGAETVENGESTGGVDGEGWLR